MKERRKRELFYRLAGGGLPPFEPAERVLLSLGGSIDGPGKMATTGRVVLTDMRLLGITQLVEPYFPRMKAEKRYIKIPFADIAEVMPISPHTRLGWLRHRFRLRLVLKTGDRVTVVTGGAQRLHDELVRLRGASSPPEYGPDKSQ